MGPKDSSERRRHHVWRKPVHGSRLEAAVTAIPNPPLVDGVEDARNQRFEAFKPRRNSRPKLARYASLFSSFKESSKGPEFAGPWSEDKLPIFQGYIDPLSALQSIRSHMINFSSKPIPLEHNNGLFCIFEDYRKVREENEYMELLLKGIFQALESTEDQWEDSGDHSEAEVRHSDLLVAGGIGKKAESAVIYLAMCISTDVKQARGSRRAEYS